MKETRHDYYFGIVGNHFDSDCTAILDSWEEFKRSWAGFGQTDEEYDDTYHFLFRYDVDKDEETGLYRLTLCHMLQRKGIYVLHRIENIDQETLDGEIEPWLVRRAGYLKSLWQEVLS